MSGVRPDGTPEPGLHLETVIFGEVVKYAFGYDRNTGRPVWGSDYYSNMCVWHLLPAWLGVDLKGLRKLWPTIVRK